MKVILLIKPSNILIGNNNEAILMDLGSVSVGNVETNTSKKCFELQELCEQNGFYILIIVTASFRAPELFDPPMIKIFETHLADIW